LIQDESYYMRLYMAKCTRYDVVIVMPSDPVWIANIISLKVTILAPTGSTGWSSPYIHGRIPLHAALHSKMHEPSWYGGPIK